MSEDPADKARKAANDAAHSAEADKAKGRTKETVGKIKEKVGSFIGNDELEAKGRLQNAEGKKDRLKGEIKETINDAEDKVKAGYEVVKDKLKGKD